MATKTKSRIHMNGHASVLDGIYWEHGVSVLLGRTYPYKYAVVDPRKVETADYNPERRTDENSRQSHFRKLQAAVLDWGIIIPIVLTPGLICIDGHRRLKVELSNGSTAIPAVIVDLPPEDVFALLNENQKPLTGNDHLVAYLKKPRAVNRHVRDRLAEMERVLGRVLMRRAAEQGASVLAFQRARLFAKYCHYDDVPAIFKWIIQKGQTQRVRTAVEAKMDTSLMLAYFRNNEPLCVC